MNKPIKDGGPAYPLQAIGPDFPPGYSGMSLRDWLAGQALQGICAHVDTWGLRVNELSIKSYYIADAMLATREANQ